MSFNVVKTEFFLFTSPKKQLDSDLKARLNGKKLYETDSVKDLGIQTEKSLIRKQQINHVATKLNQVKTILSKLTYLLDKKF